MPIYETILAAARGPRSAVLPEVAAEARFNIAWLAGQRGDLTNAEVRTAIATELRGLMRSGNYRLATLAWRMIGALYQTDVDVPRAERSVRRAARLAARSGDGSAEPRLLVDLVNLGVRSAMPIPEAIRLAERALSTNRLEHSERMWAGVHLAYLAALEGRFDDARAQFAETVAALTELGDTDTLADVTLMRARGEEEAGDDAAAEALYRVAMAMGEAGGWTGWTAGAAGRLASTLVRMGRDEEAETMAARAMAEDPTPWGPHYAGAAKARILARRGEVADAISLAQRTIADSRAAGFEAYPIIFGFTAESLAAVLVAAGRFEEARTVLHDLLPVYRAKGYVPGMRRVADELAALPSPATKLVS